jgi:hypothetical protein
MESIASALRSRRGEIFDVKAPGFFQVMVVGYYIRTFLCMKSLLENAGERDRQKTEKAHAGPPPLWRWREFHRKRTEHCLSSPGSRQFEYEVERVSSHLISLKYPGWRT